MNTHAQRQRVLFLLGDVSQARNDNHTRLPQAFAALDWEVLELPHDSVHLQAGEPRFAHLTPQEVTLIWPLGFGPEISFFDRMQLLDLIPAGQLVTGPRALTFLHGKHRWLSHMPETHTHNDVDALTAIIAQGGDWVIKPTAGSYGRDVTLVRAGEDPRPTLQHLISPDNADPRYCQVQRFVPEVAQGEIRTLVAAGQLLGSYLRVPADGVHANLELGATAARAALTSPQETLVAELAEQLLCEHVRFAAIDVVGDYLMEVNVANPGGLATLEMLYREDFAMRAAQAVVASLE